MITLIRLALVLYCIFISTVLCGKDEAKKDVINVQDQNASVRKIILPDLNKPSKDALAEYYKKEQRAVRMGKGFFQREEEKYTKLDQAIEEARNFLTERTKRWSAKSREKKRALGIKIKDYHKPDHTLKKVRVEAMQKRILQADNGIDDPEIAKEMALKKYREMNRKYGRTRRAKLAALKKNDSSRAGVSVDSGIAPYRGKDGHYTVHKSYRPIFFHEFTDQTEKGHAYRQRYWSRSFLGFPPNVDSLHHLATPSASLAASSILELHGTLQNVVCVASPTGTKPEHHTHSHAKPIDQALFDRLSLSHLTKGGPRKPPEPQPRNTPVGRLAYPKGCGFRGSRAAFQVELAQNNPQWDKLANDMEQHAQEQGKRTLLINVCPTRGDPIVDDKIEIGSSDMMHAVASHLANSRAEKDPILRRLLDSGETVLPNQRRGVVSS
ncbi:hypothetical protein L7F22_023660 [Adiantum nelumboides]|nr:hypothetical protein [Adiantum nelumboides]